VHIKYYHAAAIMKICDHVEGGFDVHREMRESIQKTNKKTGSVRPKQPCFCLQFQVGWFSILLLRSTHWVCKNTKHQTIFTATQVV